MAIFKVTHKPSGCAAVVRACCLECARETMQKACGDAWAIKADTDVELIRTDERKSIVVLLSVPPIEAVLDTTTVEPATDD